MKSTNNPTNYTDIMEVLNKSYYDIHIDMPLIATSFYLATVPATISYHSYYKKTEELLTKYCQFLVNVY